MVKSAPDAWQSYISATRALTAALDEDLSEFGLTLADYELLAHLGQAPARRMRMSELAEVALVSRSRLSHRIKVLELEGWVERVRCSEDKRGLFAVLTSRGVKKISQIAPTYKACLKKRWLSQLSATEQVQIEKIFSRINQAVSRSDLSLCDK
ncbi:MAG: MarR family transcriptional regulator [Actinobacteria bacterium]|jgi:DNA-binding MarR family transcriptional regulator|nr:MarR family transcriptional regulator [Actinomycetota bacterium]